jgi:hypothetical protein
MSWCGANAPRGETVLKHRMYQPRPVEMANEAGKNDRQTVTIFRTEGYDRVEGNGRG